MVKNYFMFKILVLVIFVGKLIRLKLRETGIYPIATWLIHVIGKC